MKSALLLSLVLFIEGVLGAAEVTGGSPATINDLPFLVSISHLGAYTCAGVILSPNLVLTSARCIYAFQEFPQTFYVRAGSSQTWSEGSVFQVAQIDRHPDFNPTTYDFDLAVLKLSSALTFEPTVLMVSLVPSDQEPADGTECVASGWEDSDGPLQSVTLPIVSRDACNQTYGGQITERMICAGGEAGKGTCPGDRGGPLLCGGRLAGIISQTNGCDLLGLPDVFADVADADVYEWITGQQ